MNCIAAKRILIFIGIIPLFFLYSCSKFDYSPYETNVADDIKNQTQKNVEKITGLNLGSNYNFAVISDIHTDYDDLTDVIEVINARGDIDFVIITGDLTHMGMKDEFLQLYYQLENLNVPVVTVIGNHDYFFNGADVYRTLMGSLNYSFIIQNTKYVFFDSNFGADGDNVDTGWLHSEVADTVSAAKTLLFAHIGPYSYINPEDSVLKRKYLEALSCPNLTYSFFGHEHKSLQNQNPDMFYVDCIGHRNYTDVSVTGQNIVITRIVF